MVYMIAASASCICTGSGTLSSKLLQKIRNPAGISRTKSNYLLESIGPDATERSVWQYARENKIGKDRERMKQVL